MKYYYISHEGPFRNNLIAGKDPDRIVRDKNKIVITRIKGRFHVLICRNGVFEKEKHILSYFELVEFLKRNSFNAYFINVNGETAYYINSYVKKDDEYTSDNQEDSKKSFFAVNGENLLKLEAFVEKKVVKEKIYDLYKSEINDDNVEVLSLFDFIENSELFGLYGFPIFEKNGKFIVPSYSYSKPNLFYMLNGIYNKEGDIINLTDEDLEVLCLAKVMNNEVASSIIDNIKVNLVDSYNLDEFNKSDSFVDFCRRQEKDIYIKLVSFKKRLEKAKKNQIIVNDLGLLNENKNSVYMKK